MLEVGGEYITGVHSNKHSKTHLFSALCLHSGMCTFVNAQSSTQMPHGILVRGAHSCGIDSSLVRLLLHLHHHKRVKLSQGEAVTTLFQREHVLFEGFAAVFIKYGLPPTTSNRVTGGDGVFPAAQR